MDWATIETIIPASRRVLVRLERPFWGGLLHYTTGSARPTYRGETDKALHFAAGAWFETAKEGLGEDVGRWKEKLDYLLGIGQYDEADLQATIDGAREARK
jgi:hypothetical protein